MSPHRNGNLNQATIARIIQAYSELVQDRINKGWDPYILTVMFNRLNGNRKTVIARMMADVETTYGRVLTRIVRCPNSRSRAGNLPVWVLSPDYPVAKAAKKNLHDVALNDGLHVGGVSLLPPNNRLDCRLDGHFFNHQRRYVGGDTNIRRIVAVPIEETPDKVVEGAEAGQGWVR